MVPACKDLRLESPALQVRLLGDGMFCKDPDSLCEDGRQVVKKRLFFHQDNGSPARI
jgi:hypothetical protein